MIGAWQQAAEGISTAGIGGRGGGLHARETRVAVDVIATAVLERERDCVDAHISRVVVVGVRTDKACDATGLLVDEVDVAGDGTGIHHHGGYRVGGDAKVAREIGLDDLVGAWQQVAEGVDTAGVGGSGRGLDTRETWVAVDVVAAAVFEGKCDSVDAHIARVIVVGVRTDKARDAPGLLVDEIDTAGHRTCDDVHRSHGVGGHAEVACEVGFDDLISAVHKTCEGISTADVGGRGGGLHTREAWVAIDVIAAAVLEGKRDSVDANIAGIVIVRVRQNSAGDAAETTEPIITRRCDHTRDCGDVVRIGAGGLLIARGEDRGELGICLVYIDVGGARRHGSRPVTRGIRHHGLENAKDVGDDHIDVLQCHIAGVEAAAAVHIVVDLATHGARQHVQEVTSRGVAACGCGHWNHVVVRRSHVGRGVPAEEVALDHHIVSGAETWEGVSAVCCCERGAHHGLAWISHAVVVGVLDEIDRHVFDADFTGGHRGAGIRIIPDLAGDAGVAHRGCEIVEEVVIREGGERAHVQRNAVVIRALGVSAAGVARWLGLDDDVGARGEVGELIEAVIGGRGDGYQSAIRRIAIGIRISVEADGDAAKGAVTGIEGPALIRVDVDTAGDLCRDEGDGGVAADRGHRVTIHVHAIVRGSAVDRRSCGALGLQRHIDCDGWSTHGEIARARDVVPKKSSIAGGIWSRRGRHKAEVRAGVEVFDWQSGDGRGAGVLHGDAEDHVAADVSRPWVRADQRLGDGVCRTGDGDVREAAAGHTTACVGRCGVGDGWTCGEGGEVQRDGDALTGSERSDICPAHGSTACGARCEAGRDKGQVRRREGIRQRDGAERGVAGVGDLHGVLQRLADHGDAVRRHDQGLLHRDGRRHIWDGGGVVAGIQGVSRIHIGHVEDLAEDRAQSAVVGSSTQGGAGGDGADKDAGVHACLSESDQLAVTAGRGDGDGHRFGHGGIGVLIEIRDTDVDGFTACIDRRARAVQPCGEVRGAWCSEVQHGHVHCGGACGIDAFRAFVCRHGDVVGAGRGPDGPGIFIGLRARRVGDDIRRVQRGADVAAAARARDGETHAGDIRMAEGVTHRAAHIDRGAAGQTCDQVARRIRRIIDA